MVEVLEKEKINTEQETLQIKSEEEKKSFKILGISIWRLFAYFIIYSFLGFLIETLFGLVTKGVIESRKSFLYGPFCGIYGLGAAVMILFLQYFKKNNFSLFFGGFLIGSIVEYVVSLFGEMVLHVIWWDYSSMPFNINGRICVAFSFFWGVLAIFLMTYCNPKVDRFISWVESKISFKTIKVALLVGIIFLLLDAIVSGFALKMFFTRLVLEHDLDLQNTQEYIVKYTKMYENPKLKEFVNKYFSDKKMLKTFPNLKVTDKDGNIIYVCDVFQEIQTEYFRVFTPKMQKFTESLLGK